MTIERMMSDHAVQVEMLRKINTPSFGSKPSSSTSEILTDPQMQYAGLELMHLARIKNMEIGGIITK